MRLFTFSVDKEDDGRFIAEVLELPGALAYGATQAEAKARVEAIALRALAKCIEHGKELPKACSLPTPSPAPGG